MTTPDLYWRFPAGNVMSQLDHILERLVQRTADGSLTWRRSGDNDKFVMSVDGITVAVTDLRGAMGFASLGQRLEIINESGQTVEVLDVNSHPTIEQEERLERLFILARRSALETQATLEKLANALTAE